MRLFTGIAIPPSVLGNIEKLLGELRPLARLNLTPAENLHITTKFIGEWPEERLAELERALGQVQPCGDIGITVAGFGFFPNPHRPRILFAGIKAGPALAELARSIEDALVPLGCAREERAYSPHLTLAKIRNENIRDLREHIASMTNTHFGSFAAVDFHLYLSKPCLSKPGPRGSVYTKLASYTLAGVGAVPR